MRTVEQLLNSSPSSFNKAEWGLLYLSWKVNWYWPKNSYILHWLLKRLAPAFRESNSFRHDFSYLKWGTEHDRKKADDGFFIRLVRDSLKTRYFVLHYLLLSLVFYIAVRTMGSQYFKYKSKTNG